MNEKNLSPIVIKQSLIGWLFGVSVLVVVVVVSGSFGGFISRWIGGTRVVWVRKTTYAYKGMTAFAFIYSHIDNNSNNNESTMYQLYSRHQSVLNDEVKKMVVLIFIGTHRTDKLEIANVPYA